MSYFKHHDVLLGEFDAQGTDVRARGGPRFPGIQIPLQLKLREFAPKIDGERTSLVYTVTRLEGELSLVFNASRFQSTARLCRLREERGPITIGPAMQGRTREVRVDCYGDLQPHHVRELEKQRGNNDLTLEIGIELTIHVHDHPELGRRIARPKENIHIQVPRSHWTDNVYPTLGGRDIFVMEIPKGERSIEAAWKKVEDAEAAFSNWSAEGTAIACREALDALDRAVKAHYGKDDCTYKERWYRAYNGVKAQASLPAHFERIKNNASCERPEKLNVTRADLECLLLRTKSLLKYAEALLEEDQ